MFQTLERLQNRWTTERRMLTTGFYNGFCQTGSASSLEPIELLNIGLFTRIEIPYALLNNSLFLLWVLLNLKYWPNCMQVLVHNVISLNTMLNHRYNEYTHVSIVSTRFWACDDAETCRDTVMSRGFYVNPCGFYLDSIGFYSDFPS